MAETAKAQKPAKAKPRIHTLDELRGFAVFCMIFYHAFYTIGVFFNFKIGIDLIRFFMPAEPFFAGLFILISGISSNLSHSNLERGAKLLFISFAVTIVTYFAVGPTEIIRFGILHMLSISMLAFGLLKKFVNFIPMWVGIIINAILFILTYTISQGYISIPFLYSYALPTQWYSSGFFYMLGFPDSGFVSSDYFPLLPWIFLFFVGGFVGKLSAAKKFPKLTYEKHIPFFGFFGRHALIIYLAHQPVIFGLCYAVQWVLKLTTHQA